MYKTLLIEGMNCGHCAGLIKIELFQISDVKDVIVDIKRKSAIVQITKPIEFDIFKEAIKKAGYTLTRSI